LTLPFFIFIDRYGLNQFYIATAKAAVSMRCPGFKEIAKKSFTDNKEGEMLQRYNISIDNDTNRLSIQEFAVIGRKPRKSEYYDYTLETFSLIHEVSYEADIIRAAIEKGAEALISEIRSPAFFPIGSCADVIAKSVTGLFNGDPESASEVFFDDRTLLSTYIEK
jgi:hypothetical protein